MKKLALAAVASALVLTGCNSMPIKDTKKMVIEGERVEVKIENINSFQVEISPRKAVCQLTDTAGNLVDSECLQYRRTFEKNFNIVPGNIEGFEYEAGYRYVLDIKQTALLNEQTRKVVPVWSLNKVVSKTSEKL